MAGKNQDTNPLTLKEGEYSGFSRWTQHNHRRVLKNRRGDWKTVRLSGKRAVQESSQRDTTSPP